MQNIILFDDNTKIDFNNSYLVNFFINNSSDDNNKLLGLRILINNSLNNFLNINDDNYHIVEISTNDFIIDYIELGSINSSLLSNIVSFEKSNKKYKLIFKKENLVNTLSFKANNLRITKGDFVRKEYLKQKKYKLDLLMLQ